MENSFSKALAKTAATLGLSFLMVSCAGTHKTPTNDRDALDPIDPHGQYENSNRPFSPPITPQKKRDTLDSKDSIDSFDANDDADDLQDDDPEIDAYNMYEGDSLDAG